MKTLRAVFDTNILVSALMSPSGAPAKVYKMFFAETVVLIFSKGIMAEYKVTDIATTQVTFYISKFHLR